MNGAPVVVAAGGTGGHVVPALAVADVLASRDVPVIWLGTKSGLEARLVPAAGIEIRWIDVAGLRGKGLIGSVTGPLRLLRACVQCLRLLMQLRPRAVLGMGGFVSGPVGLAALLLRKPLVLHEQNAIAGLTNRWLARFATRVLSAWPGAFDNDARVLAVGNPVRRDVADLAEHVRASAELHKTETEAAAIRAPLEVLVVGGSRGARVLNETVPAAVALLERAVNVRHQSGQADAEAVRERYAALSSGAQVEPFIDDMAAAYRTADLVICRSGAMTVTELSALGLPSILVPFPHAVDDHQNANARRLSDAGGAVRITQDVLSPARLAVEIERLDVDRSALAQMADAARRCFLPGAAEAVADALMECSR